ncbi:SusD/RagB family nutrient-binding outer membrane lipoprotein [Prolixibacteraceae bacterium Z1-6]|uniref:SusD/RagB family nutrient-binding outer membrane lipoprotein n=1 Tax=Draconibacterium aestuarii TaxID=2998507 RepID=A0A9X3J947_9BACT|nr:SusD/RagB family nutrient-binding outer membrane lipoprotein [Prolixibacteraceae bacterium Z1-6]
MKLLKATYKLLFVLLVVSFASCNDYLTELNENPNGVNPEDVNPNLMLPKIISQTGTEYLKESFNSSTAGVMQYVQLSGWGNSLNKYTWNGTEAWDKQYGILRNAKHLYNRAGDEDMEFHQAVATVIRVFNFGYITDSWGDAPYSAAVNSQEGGQEDLFPAFDSQEEIYRGIIEELKTANTLLSKTTGEYVGMDGNADFIYGGDPEKWRKMANSLMLRYYMRVSEKLPDYAKEGIEEIISNPNQYPIFTSSDDDATMSFIGSSTDDSWPSNTTYDVSQDEYTRIQLCAGFRDVLVDYNDPRIAVWFNEVKVPIKLSDKYDEADVIVDGIRYVHVDSLEALNYVVYNRDTWVDDINAEKTLIDTMNYAGMPIASSTGDGSGWNLNPDKVQGGPNVHNSALDDKYKAASGDMLRARLISYSEVCFILAEAAQKGWNVGSQQTWYEEGIRASFEVWGVSADYDTYIVGEGVAYDGTQEQIMTQKWIANWTAAHESWCDWKRTGYPVLTVGPKGLRDAMPLRKKYPADEIARNNANYAVAREGLVETSFTATDGKDSAWSKFWLLQGTNKPY